MDSESMKIASHLVHMMSKVESQRLLDLQFGLEIG